MRNPEIFWAEELVKKIFDHEDQELGIDLEARCELIRALSTNTKIIEEGKRFDYRDFDREHLYYVPDAPRNNRIFFSELWTLASKWPKETGIQSEGRFIFPIPAALSPHASAIVPKQAVRLTRR